MIPWYIYHNKQHRITIEKNKRNDKNAAF